MKILDVLKVVPREQSIIIDVYVNEHLYYCSVMDDVETTSDALTKMRVDVFDLDVTEISTRRWENLIAKREEFSLVIVSDN